MSQQGRRLQDAVLDMYLTGSLDPEARGRVESVLEGSEADRARLAELRADSEAFLVRHPPAAFVARLEPAPRGSTRRWGLLLGPALAACVAAVLVALPPRPEEAPPAYVAKGGLVLGVYRLREGTGVPVEPGETLAAGDALRFEVKAGANGYVAVLSRDGAGRVTVYHPYGGAAAVAYTPQQPVLPGSIELDGTPGAEELYALFSPEPFALAPAVEALSSGTPLESALPGAVRISRARFDKRP
ncbi:uncharacterized protein DUF4384 [Archangium gephyra]|uniref:ActD n=1 Tax=Archangium gephyra TaxID=48 RepID=A0AAC8QJI0_9BACT|nr:DUF4384 domain-containing protein [Archangium gephyra]AKJ08376.1 ActD [Archangium gephyra]REG14177.1 uncharacterized protein DUF4384 [Archangium gephyra]